MKANEVVYASHRNDTFDKAKRAYEAGIIKPGECWTQIYGFSKYMIGLHGEVMSMVKEPRILRPISIGEYVGYQLSDDNHKIKKMYLHRLIAEAAYGPCPDGLECCHNDGNPNNNDASNLRWDTHKNNESDKPFKLCGENNPRSKYTEKLVLEIRRRYKSGEKQSEIADSIGMSRMNVSRIVNNKLWVKK